MARAASRVQRYEENGFRGRQLFFHALQLELRLASFRPMDAEFYDLTVDELDEFAMTSPPFFSLLSHWVSLRNFDVLLDGFYKLLVKFLIENSSRRKQNPSRSTSDYSILARRIQKLYSLNDPWPPG